MTRGGNFWLGTLIGAAAGAAVALLYAPKPGEELRHDVSSTAREAGRKAGAAWGDVKDRASDMTSSVKDRVMHATGRGQEMMESGKSRVAEAVNEGKRAAAEKRRELKSELEAKEQEIASKAG